MEDFYCREVLSKNLTVDIVAENDFALAFHHTKPYWPTHIVVIPKKHTLSVITADRPTLSGVMEIIQEASKFVLDSNTGCEVLSNIGTYQDTQHMHWHVISGKPIRQVTTETFVQ